MNVKLSVIVATFNNSAILDRCLQSWQQYTSDLPIELLVVADGCTDNTSEVLKKWSESDWGKFHLRCFTENNVHELLCTNRGIKESKGELILSWHDDMFLTTHFLIPELISFFDRNLDIGLLGLCRGLQCKTDTLPQSWEELTNPNRLMSTVGPKAWNWFTAYEVDAIMRPWITRRACIDKVGHLDTAFKLSEWDEADLCYRISGEGWKIATHSYERLGAYTHLGSSTIGRTISDVYKQQVLANGQLFYSRWSATIRKTLDRPRQTWRRQLTATSLLFTCRAIAYDIVKRLRYRLGA